MSHGPVTRSGSIKAQNLADLRAAAQNFILETDETIRPDLQNQTIQLPDGAVTDSKNAADINAQFAALKKLMQQLTANTNERRKSSDSSHTTIRSRLIVQTTQYVVRCGHERTVSLQWMETNKSANPLGY